MNKYKASYVLIVLVLLVTFLSSCENNTHINISSNEISKVWMETYPAKSDSPKYTEDEEIIKAVASYINGLKLRPRTESDEAVDGMTVRIDILMNDGTWKTFFDGRKYFTDNDAKQYVMEYEQAIALDSIYAKLDTVPLFTGTVSEVNVIDENKVNLLVTVDSEFHGIIGGKTYVTVENQRLYKSGYPNADVGVGDTVEFTINGSIRETYPTGCEACKLTITIPASGLYFQHIPTVSEDSNPYFVLFQELFSADPGLNSEIQYISVDLSNVKLADTSDYIELMKAWCEKNGYLLLEQTFDQLVEGGWIIDLGFKDGILISYEDVSLSEDKLVTDAKKWRSGDGAIGAEYTLTIKNGKWSISKTDKQWIS